MCTICKKTCKPGTHLSVLHSNRILALMQTWSEIIISAKSPEVLTLFTISSFNHLANEVPLSCFCSMSQIYPHSFTLEIFMATNGENANNYPQKSCHTYCMHISVCALCNLMLSDMSTHKTVQAAFTVFKCINYSCCDSFTCFHPFLHYHPSASWETLSHYYPTIIPLFQEKYKLLL